MSTREVIIPIGPSIAYVPLTQGQYALIDSDDAEDVGKDLWYAHYSPFTKSFYAKRKRVVDGKTTLYPLHRHIMGDPHGLQVDHVRGNTLDNRRSQLRAVTRFQNVRNAKLRKDNLLGFKGVQLRNSGRYRAVIRVNRKAINLGSFATPEEAHAAYCAAAIEHFGEFARIA
jgi:hypothetical protein